MSQIAERAIPKIVSSKLANLRLKIGFWLFVEGLSRIVPTILGLFLFVFLVDRTFEMDVTQRVIMSVLAILTVLIVAFFKVVKPFMQQQMSDDALCLEVEKQNRDLKEGLISAVQFSRSADLNEQGVSSAMVAATIESGTSSAKGLNFGSALNNQRYLFNVVLLLASTVLLGVFVYGMLNNEVLKIFAHRFFVYDGQEYPKKTYIEFYDPDGLIVDNKLKLYRGQDSKLIAHIREDSEVKDVELEMKYREGQSGAWEIHGMKQTKRFEGREYEIVYKAIAVDFQVQARGGDGRSSVLQIELEDPPRFENLSAIVTYPEYSVEVHKDERIRVFENEKVYRFAGGDASLKNAWEELGDITENGKKLVDWELVDEEQLQTIASKLAEDPTKTYPQIGRELKFFTERQYAEKLLAEENIKSVRYESERIKLRGSSEYVENLGAKLVILEGSSVQLQATANRELAKADLVHSQFSMPFSTSEDGSEYLLAIPSTAIRNGQYHFSLRDKSMRTPPRSASFEVEIEADQEPKLQIDKKGISGLVIPRARIPLTINVTDDSNIVDAYLKFNWQDDLGQRKAEGEIRFGQYEPVPSWDASEADEPKNLQELLPSKKISLTEQYLDLDELPEEKKVPENSGLKFVVVAIDNDDVPSPNTGTSKEFLIRVVSEEEFRADLLRRERQARKEFDLIYQRQQATRNDIEALAADEKTDDESLDDFHTEIKNRLATYNRNQRSISEGVEAVVERMNDLLTEALNNRLDETTGEFETRYTTKIIGPMQTITDELMFELETELDSARLEIEDGAKRFERLSNALEIQDAILSKMEEILEEMEKNEGIQELINNLFETRKKEANLKDLVKKELEKRIKGAGSGSSDDDKDEE